jgi:hypothetical protein
MRAAKKDFECLVPRWMFWQTHLAAQSLDLLSAHYGIDFD